MLAQEGFPVILDAKYDRIAYRQQVIETASSNNISLQIVNCIAPMDMMRDRLNKRTGDISDATADLLASQQDNAEEFTSEEAQYVTTIDTSQDNWESKLIH